MMNVLLARKHTYIRVGNWGSLEFRRNFRKSTSIHSTYCLNIIDNGIFSKLYLYSKKFINCPFIYIQHYLDLDFQLCSRWQKGLITMETMLLYTCQEAKKRNILSCKELFMCFNKSRKNVCKLINSVVLQARIEKLIITWSKNFIVCNCFCWEAGCISQLINFLHHPSWQTKKTAFTWNDFKVDI